jgi:hypothetical protein
MARPSRLWRAIATPAFAEQVGGGVSVPSGQASRSAKAMTAIAAASTPLSSKSVNRLSGTVIKKEQDDGVRTTTIIKERH